MTIPDPPPAALYCCHCWRPIRKILGAEPGWYEHTETRKISCTLIADAPVTFATPRREDES